MKNLITFIQSTKVKETELFALLKCKIQEAKFLQYITKEYIQGRDSLMVLDILSQFYNIKKFEHIEKIVLIKNLLELGWIVQSNMYEHVKLSEISMLELLNSSITLSPAFLKIVEDGTLDLELPEIKEYSDHLEYLQDQFSKIALAQKLKVIKSSFDENAPNINRLKTKLDLLDKRIKERIEATKTDIMIENFFDENSLAENERMIFLSLLKEEYASSDEGLRDMNSLIDLVSCDDYEKIKHRSLLEESSTLVSNGLIDYDEMLTPFGGISRNFFIPEEILYKISHPTKKKTRVAKIKLDSVIKEQKVFELISTNKDLDDVVLNSKTKETLNALLKQVDKEVMNRLKDWGIKDKKKGIEAKIIFYGAAGTGKTITALALAKSLKRQVISFDCSKILSMYIGESEKNVRDIFEKYKEIKIKTRTEPILLLNEADQFLSSRVSGTSSSSDKMHNQMQNIFLEQIERFDGILIATTNLLENLDKAFSRRFNYKIEFVKPNEEQRLALWKKLMPETLPLEKDFDLSQLAAYELTGGQVELIIKNTAYKVAVMEEAIFTVELFKEQITKEKKGQFDQENKVGFF